ncbi:MAG TPA: class I SAM-dependent methyltransferase [Chloroflexota bacterium]
MPPAASVRWAEWLRRWDAQQAGYLPHREERFAAMLDVLEALLPAAFVAVDLACGPGAISQRLLARFPDARCVAVDTDPVLLALGQGALGDQSGRLRWVKADLTEPDWSAALGEEQVDAVLSATALHWLPGDALTRVYRALGQLVRPGGVFLNGDRAGFPPHMPTFRALAEAGLAQRERGRPAGSEDWAAWWEALRREPDLAELFAERERRFAWRQPWDRRWESPIRDLHEAALREAGFREVGVVWQRLDDHVLLAVR